MRRAHSGRWYRVVGFLGRLVLNLALLAISLACLVPFAIVVSASFSSEEAIALHGYTLLPRQFSLLAYRYLLGDPAQILQSYGVSILVTAIGSSIGMLIMSLLAYALSRQRFQLRQPIAFFLFFTLLFNGGLVPSYVLITQYLHLKDTPWVLILPGLVSAWNVLVLRTFFRDLPEELLDAAKIDGAGEWRTFFQIAVPLCTPGLATIGLFTMLAYWNDWFTPLLYIDNRKLYPVQYLLYTAMNNIQFIESNAQTVRIHPPALPARMAIAVLAIGPIAFGYLFVQKYFVRGIRLGSIKG